MKETKVWIDREFPQVYFDPKTGNEYIEGRPLILEDIKIHDQELIKEVCEKIREKVNKTDFNKIPQKVQQAIKFSICYEIDQIQKEYEK